VWEQVIRTGNVEQDQWMLQQARAHASAQGLVLQVTSLPEGGLHVRAVAPSAAPLQAPTAQPGQRQFMLTLRKHTGMIVLMRTQSYRFQGTLEQCEAAYRSAQTHNLLAGWWGMFSLLFMNWFAIFSNMSAIGKVRRLASAPAPPGPPNAAVAGSGASQSGTSRGP
jgi:hypothetical protein